MLIKRAAEAEIVTAVAVYGRYYPLKISRLDLAIDGIYAVRCGAPLEVLEVVDICACEQFGVSGV